MGFELLRVAVAVGPAASAFWTTRDPVTGKPVGFTVELAKAAAQKLQVALELVEFQSSDEIAAAGSRGAWGISFMPADIKQEQFVDQGPAYVMYLSGYLVRAGSDIGSVAEIDRPGIRVRCIERTSTSRTVERTLKAATLTKFMKPETAAELIRDGQLDALAMGMEALEDLSRGLPGRVLDEVIQSTGVVVVVPKGELQLMNGRRVSLLARKPTVQYDEPPIVGDLQAQKWRPEHSTTRNPAANGFGSAPRMRLTVWVKRGLREGSSWRKAAVS
jgi:polar amino acid transport system substrate-binding protein